jgi:hypothetical protein
MKGREKNTWRQWLCVIVFVFERSEHIRQKWRWFVWLSSFWCLKGIKTKGENDDNHRWLLSFVFHRNDNREKKSHEDNDYVPSSLCLKGAEIRGEDDNVSMIIIIFYFSKEQWQGEKQRHKDDDCLSSSQTWRWQCLYDRYHFLFFKGTMTRRKTKTQRWWLCVIISMYERSWKRRWRQNYHRSSFFLFFIKVMTRRKMMT